jgi:hypothetical protein
MRRHARVLSDTLRLTGAADATGLRLRWSDVPDRPVGSLIAAEGGTQWLLRRFHDLAIADAPALGTLIEGLAARARGEIARAMLVDAEAEALLRRLAARDIPCIAIKGTARRAAAARYRYADARATRDVDVLLPRDQVQPLWDSLRAEGWPLATDPSATPADHFHPPPLLGPHRVAVELHWATGRGMTDAVAWSRAAAGVESVSWHGSTVRVPDATELLWHGLTHALGREGEAFTLRHLLDGAVILAAAADAVDWDRLGARLTDGEAGDPLIARAWLRAAGSLAGAAVPPRVAVPSASFDLEQALAFRLAVMRRLGGTALGRRALVEGTRVALGLGPAALAGNPGTIKRARRLLGSTAARTMYRYWEARDRARLERATPPPRS